MTHIAAEYAAHGFVVVPSMATDGERMLLTHVQPTLVLSGQTITTDVRQQELPPALLTRCQILATELLKEPAKLAFAQWYAKPPNSPEATIHWHQDRASWPAARPPTVTIWLALDRSDLGNGCLEMLSSSHQSVELLPHRLGPAELLTCRRAIPEEIQKTATKAFANPGDAVIYHERIAHRSGPNGSDHWRRAVVLGWNSAGI